MLGLKTSDVVFAKEKTRVYCKFYLPTMYINCIKRFCLDVQNLSKLDLKLLFSI